MEFTGERYVPTEGGEIRQEHLHRYAWCLPAVVGKDVLDIASGEGYGSAMLAAHARSVVGVDISADLEDARRRVLVEQARPERRPPASRGGVPLDVVVAELTAPEFLEPRRL